VSTWRERLEVPDVVAYHSIGSTLDAAHALAAGGAPAGTVVVAERQTAGRGRDGKRWSSPPGQGVWLSVVERPARREALDVLAIRVGLCAAEALDAFAEEPIRLKWPNDLYVEGRKLAGTLVEVRWRGAQLDWVAIGFGVNVTAPEDEPRAGHLDAGTSPASVLEAVVPALRAAARADGLLATAELEAYTGRDLARGHRCIAPVPGRVVGISAAGELLVELADSTVAVRSGSLILE